MPTEKRLHLHEEMLLLCLHDEAGTSLAGGWEAYALAGAAFAELLLTGRLGVSEDKKHLVDVLDTRTTGNEVLDECLQKIADTSRRARASAWVQRLARLKDLRHRVARDLCRKGVLRADEDRVLLLFRRRIYPEVDPRPERAIQRRLEQALFGAGDVDPRTSVLISIANSVSLLKGRFERDAFKGARKRLQAIARGDLAGRAAHQAVAAAQASAMMAVTAAIAASTAVTAATASR